MLAITTDLHLQDPSRTDTRVLTAGRVVDAAAAGPVVEFADLRCEVRPDRDVLVYLEHRRQFMQQSARILALEPVESGQRLTLELVGEPVSAESREHYRVPVTAADYFVTLDGAEECRMVDVSITGFAALAPETYQVGEELDAAFRLDGDAYRGAMVVQSVCDLGRPGVRCGLRVREQGGGGRLGAGVRALALHAEREMLRRMSGRD